MINKTIISLFGLIIGFNCFSQKDSLEIEKYRERIESTLPNITYWDSAYYDFEKSYGFTSGFNVGKNAKGIELGFGKMSKGRIGSHLSSSGIYIGTEILVIKSENKLLFAPKIGLWADGGSSAGAAGLDFIYYTNQSETQFRIRPEIGVGLMGFQIVYGYNFRLGNKKVDWINDHNFKMILSFGVFKKKRIQITYREGFERYEKRKLNK